MRKLRKIYFGCTSIRVIAYRERLDISMLVNVEDCVYIGWGWNARLEFSFWWNVEDLVCTGMGCQNDFLYLVA